MYSYLRTQETDGRTYEDTKGLILYPYVDIHLNEDILVQNYLLGFSGFPRQLSMRSGLKARVSVRIL